MLHERTSHNFSFKSTSNFYFTGARPRPLTHAPYFYSNGAGAPPPAPQRGCRVGDPAAAAWPRAPLGLFQTT